jgi:hypothetical protein
VAKARGKKKFRKPTRKHGSSCKCQSCCANRKKKKQLRKQKAWKKYREDQIIKGVPYNNFPGFLSGGHQKLKKADLFEMDDDPLYNKARLLVLNCTNSLGEFRPKEVISYRYESYDPLSGWELFRTYKLALDSSKFEALKNEKRFQDVEFLWHGTPCKNISSIAHHGMRLGRSGLLGAGIYTTPHFFKAWGFTGYYSGGYRTILFCAVRLGNVWDTNKFRSEKVRKPTASLCHQNGCDTSFAGAGKHLTAWRGSLTYSEYCCYDEAQVKPLYALVFKAKIR